MLKGWGQRGPFHEGLGFRVSGAITTITAIITVIDVVTIITSIAMITMVNSITILTMVITSHLLVINYY